MLLKQKLNTNKQIIHNPHFYHARLILISTECELRNKTKQYKNRNDSAATLNVAKREWKNYSIGKPRMIPLPTIWIKLDGGTESAEVVPSASLLSHSQALLKEIISTFQVTVYPII